MTKTTLKIDRYDVRYVRVAYERCNTQGFQC